MPCAPQGHISLSSPRHGMASRDGPSSASGGGGGRRATRRHNGNGQGCDIGHSCRPRFQGGPRASREAGRWRCRLAKALTQLPLRRPLLLCWPSPEPSNRRSRKAYRAMALSKPWPHNWRSRPRGSSGCPTATSAQTPRASGRNVGCKHKFRPTAVPQVLGRGLVFVAHQDRSGARGRSAEAIRRPPHHLRRGARGGDVEVDLVYRLRLGASALPAGRHAFRVAGSCGSTSPGASRCW